MQGSGDGAGQGQGGEGAVRVALLEDQVGAAGVQLFGDQDGERGTDRVLVT